MTRVRMCLLLGFGLLLAALFAPRPAAHAAPPEVQYDFGENTEEVALKRWQENQARHWRTTMTRR